jgi:hypothetical protein
VQVDPARLDAMGVEQVDPLLERRDSIRYFSKIILSHRLLGLEVERGVVGRHRLDQAVAKAIP